MLSAPDTGERIEFELLYLGGHLAPIYIASQLDLADPKSPWGVHLTLKSSHL